MKVMYDAHIKQKGQVVLLALIFTSALLIALMAMVGYSVASIAAHRHAVSNVKALNIAEAAAEVAVWKLNNQGGYTGESNTAYGEGTYTVSVTSIDANNKSITVTGYVPDATNPISTKTVKLKASVGTTTVSFQYGVQAGKGGFLLSNNSGVNGNVYANGNITGSGFITGSASAANSSALNADQSNGSDTPLYDISFGSTNATQDFAQSFVPSTTDPVNKVRFYIRKFGNPADRIVRIVSNSGSNPGTTVHAVATLSASLVTTNYGWVEAVFTSNPVLDEGTTYWVVIDGSTSSSNYYVIGGNTSYTSGTGKLGQQGGTWNNTSPSGLDGYFQIYLGGITSVISGITVGQAGLGNAHAHTVNNSTIAGTLYCQTGSGNNASCNTSLPDPSATAMPISDANIEQWKEEAEAGGVISGNYSPASGSTVTLGPKKITGNMILDNNVNLTISGIIWVQGTISISNNVTISLSPSYGSGSSTLLSDGRITLGNNVAFNGSGTAGSYIMLLTTSDCPISASCGSSPAIDVQNNAGTVILNAQNGTISFSNNSGAKEATAYQISLSNNAVITYESGLANVNFVSGPGGSWEFVPGSYVIVQ